MRVPAALLAVVLPPAAVTAAESLGPVPRAAVVSAFAPEWEVLRAAVVDPQARPTVELARCAAPNGCLDDAPHILVGGNGVSGQAFVDNAEFCTYAHATFAARVLDMETAAVAHAAFANRVPFIAFRSLSDLAGGGEGENQMATFFQLAADNAAMVVWEFLKGVP